MSSPAQEPAGLPLYAGPSLPRWQPRSADDLEAALADGTLTEHHWVDVKREVGSGDGAKKELARDLASFANDGGCYLIGIAEDKPTQTFTLEPAALAGLAEKIDQVVRSRCDPPLYVACHPLTLPGDPERGVLLVEIPPSPLAPHMVDGVYWGRGDSTKHKLSDNEVARLHALRIARHRTAEQLIQRERNRDPTPSAMREHSHLFVVAEPLASPPDLLDPLLGTSNLNSLVQRVPQLGQGYATSPSWQSLSSDEPRAAGWGWHSFDLPGRIVNADAREKRLLDLEVSDDGRVALFAGRGSDSAAGQSFILERVALSLTRNVLTLAAQLGASSGYAGRWLLAVGLTDLAGKQASRATDGGFYRDEFPRFSAPDYVQGTEANTRELLDQPGAVTRRLLRRLLRALGVEQDHAGLLGDE